MFLSYKRCYISYHTYYREPKATELCPECKSPAHTHQEPSKTVPSRTPKPYHQKPRQKTKKTKQNVTFCRVVFPFCCVFWGNGLGDTAGYDFGCGGTVSGCMARAAKVQGFIKSNGDQKTPRVRTTQHLSYVWQDGLLTAQLQPGAVIASCNTTCHVQQGGNAIRFRETTTRQLYRVKGLGFV